MLWVAWKRRSVCISMYEYVIWIIAYFDMHMWSIYLLLPHLSRLHICANSSHWCQHGHPLKRKRKRRNLFSSRARRPNVPTRLMVHARGENDGAFCAHTIRWQRLFWADDVADDCSAGELLFAARFKLFLLLLTECLHISPARHRLAMQ